MDESVIVVGAGLSGLVCARALTRANKRVTVIDRLGHVGGRVWTNEVDGFRIDQGFQVLFNAYPNARRELDFAKLGFRKFTPGALVHWNGRLEAVMRDDYIHMAFTGFLGLRDKMRIAQFSSESVGRKFEQCWELEDVSALVFLRRYGFGESFMERFARPFFGGVFLDRELSVSARNLAFIWKALSLGDTGVPERGMAAVATQIADDIPSDRLWLGTEVAKLDMEGGTCRGVVLANGDRVAATKVVVATDPAEEARLTAQPVDTAGRGCTTVAFDATMPPTEDPILIVNGNFPGRVQHVAPMTNVARSLAPPGRHLVTATILGTPPMSDARLAGDVQYELQEWFPDADVSSWRPLRVDRIPFAQAADHPGARKSEPGPTSTPGLYLAGEATTYSGIDGAILSGRKCAQALLQSGDMAGA
ncbi:MAG: FAD-dependent oxidoreductase [Fimbriimonadaceae bacterium]|nr:FAD-dependent oxidoreductase [Fimbriimonadaceae bacterium]QYK56612.1 MAG: FAD-dependent oxidoreductase [Fimbriimonadaceae bacterium]